MARNKYRRQPWKKQQKTVHNQHKPFNPGKYGKLWASMNWECEWGRTPQGDAHGPVIGKLCIGGQQFELTWTECNRLIETLTDAKHQHKVGTSMGFERGHGTYRG